MRPVQAESFPLISRLALLSFVQLLVVEMTNRHGRTMNRFHQLTVLHARLFFPVMIILWSIS